MSKYKRLQEIKFLGFRKGLFSSSEPNAGVEGLTRSLNLFNYTLPEKLQSRPSYQLKYETPIGTQPNLTEEEFISFDNFFDRRNEGAEITLYLTKAKVTSTFTDFSFYGLQVYARPFYNGSFWVDSWANLTKTYITTIKAKEIINGKNVIRLNGNYGNLAQWKLINYTLNKSFPYAIMKSFDDGNDTVVIINNQFVSNLSFSINDVVVLMQDYIPISTLKANAQATKFDVEFVRGTNKAIIGFGGGKDTRALVIEHINRWLYMDTSPFALNEQEDENFRHTNRLVIDEIVHEYPTVYSNTIKDSGDLPAGKYSGIFVLAFNNIELKRDNETFVELSNNQKVTFIPHIYLGYLSRRLQSVELFFNHDLLNHYKVNTYEVSGDDKNNKIWKSNGYDDIYITQDTAPDTSNIHNENCATSPSNSNSVGSWLQRDTTNYDGDRKTAANIGNDSGDYYVEALGQQVYETDPNTGYGVNSAALFYPLNKLDKIPIGDYVIKIKFKYVDAQFPDLYLALYANNDAQAAKLLKVFHLFHDNWVEDTFEINFDKEYKWLELLYWDVDSPPTTLYLRIADLKIIPRNNVEITANSQLGEELFARLGYFGDLVKDFGVSHVRNNTLFLSSVYIKEKYRNTIFNNAINSDGSNMQTIIPADNALQIESIYGQNIIGINSVPNSNLVVFTESTITILDAEKGSSVERIVGSGLKSRFSLVSIKGSIYFVSDNDILKISPSTGYIPQPITAFTIRRQYLEIKRKDLITACFDRFSAYRLSLDQSETINYKELIFVDEFGFSEMEREHHPILLRNGLFGFVWFAGNDYNIYSEPYNIEEVIGYADKYGDYRAGW